MIHHIWHLLIGMQHLSATATIHHIHSYLAGGREREIHNYLALSTNLPLYCQSRIIHWIIPLDYPLFSTITCLIHWILCKSWALPSLTPPSGFALGKADGESEHGCRVGGRCGLEGPELQALEGPTAPETSCDLIKPWWFLNSWG